MRNIISRGKATPTIPVDMQSGKNYNTTQGNRYNPVPAFGVPNRGMRHGGHVQAMLGKSPK